MRTGFLVHFFWLGGSFFQFTSAVRAKKKMFDEVHLLNLSLKTDEMMLHVLHAALDVSNNDKNSAGDMWLSVS